MIDEKFFMEILQSREDRRDRQIDLLEKYKASLVSFTLNTPGIIKDNDMYRDIHKEGMASIIGLLRENHIGILYKEAISKATGNEGYILVDFEATKVKVLLIGLEESHPLGRIFDMDVFDKDHKQISRTDLNLGPRKCLICSKPARTCIREASHTYEDLYSHVKLLWSEHKTV